MKDMKSIRIRGYDVSVVFIVMLLIISLMGSVIAVLYVQRSVTHTASIKAVGDIKVYSDLACTVELTSYAWNEGYNEYKDKPFYIKNLGNTVVNLEWDSPDWIGDTDKTDVKYSNSAFYLGIPPNPRISSSAWMPRDSTKIPDVNFVKTISLGVGVVLSTWQLEVTYLSTTPQSSSFSTVFYANS